LVGLDNFGGLDLSKIATFPQDKASAVVAPTAFGTPFFRFENASFIYEPYPIGLITPVIDQQLYDRLVDSYPDISLFKKMSYLGDKDSVKYSLAEMNNPNEYREFLSATPVWREFYDWVKSPDFIVRSLAFLAKHNVELGYLKPRAAQREKTLVERLTEAFQGRKSNGDLPLSARFEFSVLPADGGQLHPHTDSPSKIITWVVSMVRPGEWNPSFGGSTDMMRPKRTELNFNWVNRYLEFEDVDILHAYDFRPNQALVFIKTFNSWHGVKTMTGTGSNLLRRTLTINIEKIDQ
jgi:hypothetical protein